MRNYFQDLVGYVNSTRGIGHTRLMIEGLEHFEGEAIVVAHSYDYAKQICARVMEVNPKARLTPRGLEQPRLRGCTGPMAFDNSALSRMFIDCDEEVDRMHRKVRELEEWKAKHPINNPRESPVKKTWKSLGVSFLEDFEPEFQKCAKPDCDRLVNKGVLYCCHGCTLAAEGKYEIHESGPLGHSPECNARQVNASAAYQDQVFVELTRDMDDASARNFIQQYGRIMKQCEDRKRSPFAAARTLINAESNAEALRRRQQSVKENQ